MAKKKSKRSNFFKYTGLLSLVVAAVAFVLFMVTPAVVGNGFEAVGTTVIFGGNTRSYAGGVSIYSSYLGSMVWSAFLSWILVLVSLLILLLAAVLPLAKVKLTDKLAGLLNLVAVGALVVAGVFGFMILGIWAAVNGVDLNGTSYGAGAGWVIASILSIVAGGIALCPAAADFLSKSKK